MQLSLTFIRILFFGLSILLGITFAIEYLSSENFVTKLALGSACGALFGGIIISLDLLFKRLNLRTFNTAIAGLFFGYLMGSAVLLIIQTAFHLGIGKLESQIMLALQTVIYLTACYMGMVLTARAANELFIRIPFFQNQTTNSTKKDILIDNSALTDQRTIDLAVSGLLDQNLIIPRFLLKELHMQAESADEGVRQRARKGLEAYKKLEAIPSLELRYDENIFPEIHDLTTKFVKLARHLEASILTVDPSRTQSTSEGIRYINLHFLSNALKPLAINGESLNIKIQRYGKEPRQGVGYLDDGTMVVVNGAADFIGATIRAQVLSVKHTSSGRMIFCNAADSDFSEEPALAGVHPETENSASNYFAV